MIRIKEDSQSELIIKKSRFLCYLHRCFSEEDAKAFIVRIKKEHPNANHYCYAFIIGEQHMLQRSNDDGEPSRSAGVPILECLINNDLQDVIAVVVRYFGGIKLGAGGLIRAYSKSVSNTLQNTILCKSVKMSRYALDFSYNFTQKLDYYFRQQAIQVTLKEYNELVHYEYTSLKSIEEDIKELTSGRYLPSFIEDVIIEQVIENE
ncbi:MAG: YigZ family protein [Longicatena sp.]